MDFKLGTSGLEAAICPFSLLVCFSQGMLSKERNQWKLEIESARKRRETYIDRTSK